MKAVVYEKYNGLNMIACHVHSILRMMVEVTNDKILIAG